MIWTPDARSIKGLDVSLQRLAVIINVIISTNIILIMIMIIVRIMIICLVENGGDYRR